MGVETTKRDRQNLRLWLKLLASTGSVERRVRSLLRSEFDTTLPRFDVLAELYRKPGGVTMGELSGMLMVSNGNLTGLAGRLQQEGLIARAPNPTDKRIQLLFITRKGKTLFEEMASEHKKWVADAFDNLQDAELEQLLALLSRIDKSPTQEKGDRDDEL